MKALTKIFLSCAVFFSLPATAATEANLLMFAAEFNVMKALAPRCDLLMPGYLKEFLDTYNEARSSLERAGVTEAVLAEAETFPELSSTPFPAKFDKRAEEEKKRICNQHLQRLKETANASKEKLR